VEIEFGIFAIYIHKTGEEKRGELNWQTNLE